MVLTGTVRADERAPGTPGGFELGVTELHVVQLAGEYPISPKEHGVEFLMDRAICGSAPRASGQCCGCAPPLCVPFANGWTATAIWR